MTFSRLMSSDCDFSDLKSTSPIHTSFPNTTAINSSAPGRCGLRSGTVSVGEDVGGEGGGGRGIRIVVGRGEYRRMLRGR